MINILNFGNTFYHEKCPQYSHCSIHRPPKGGRKVQIDAIVTFTFDSFWLSCRWIYHRVVVSSINKNQRCDRSDAAGADDVAANQSR